MIAENLWYIKLRDWGDRGNRKKPAETLGSLSSDFETNDSVYTWDETQEMDHGNFGIVGHRGDDRQFLGLDADVYKLDEFEIDDISVADAVLIVRSTAPERSTPGFQFFFEVLDPNLDIESAFPWVDIKGLERGYVVSPFHENKWYEVLNEPTRLPLVQSVDEINEAVSYKGQDLVIKNSSSVTGSSSVELPDESPGDLPHCAQTLAHIREQSELRNEYTGVSGPFSVDSHLGQVLIANGYDMEEAMSIFAGHPPPDGYDAQKTRDHLERLYRKHEAGDLHPPIGALEPEVDIRECDCEIHGFDSRWVTFLPEPDAEWDWENSRSMRLDDVHEHVESVLEDALTQRVRTIIEAVPGMGKSKSTIIAAERTGEPITVLVCRGWEEMYQKYEDWCDEVGLDSYRLPVFTRDCETARGDFGKEIQEEVRRVYNRGGTGREIHMHMDLPCTEGDHECEYQRRWSSSAIQNSDVLIGHYSHAYVPSARSGRTLVFDEFDETAFEMELTAGEVNQAVTRFLQEDDRFEFDNVSQVKETGDFGVPPGIIGENHEGVDLTSDEKLAFTDGGHADAPYALLTIMFGDTRDDGLQTLSIHGRRCVYNRENGSFRVLTPPTLSGCDGIVILDGTPVQEMWELVLDTNLDHHIVLEDQREEFLTEARNMTFVQTNPHVNTVGIGGENVDTERTRELIRAVRERHDAKPGVVTHPTAMKEYEGSFEDLSFQYFGNLLGSNEFTNTHVGVVTHGSHFGDDYVKRWCAYARTTMEREGSGLDLTYGDFGDSVLRYMRESRVLQGALRFGRDDSPSWVYVDTATLPDWVPVTDIGNFRSTDGRNQVLKAIKHVDEPFTASQIADQVDITVRQVRNILKDLHENGTLDQVRTGQTYFWSVADDASIMSMD